MLQSPQPYKKMHYPDNPLDKIYDMKVYDMIIDYLQRRPALRMEVIRELFAIEYAEAMPGRVQEYKPDYGIAGEDNWEEVIVKVKSSEKEERE